MAGRLKLTLGLALLVLLGHSLVLDWLAGQWRPVRALDPMAEVMFTRTLRPSESTVVAPPPAPRVRKPRPAPNAPATAAIVSPATPDGTPTAAPATPAEMPATSVSTPTVAVAAAMPTPTATLAGNAPAGSTATAPLPAPSLAAPGTSTTPVTPSLAWLERWPVDTRLRYRLGGYWRGEINGNAKVQWQRSGERYQVEIEIGFGVGSVRMISQGRITPERLEPDIYEEQLLNRRRPIEFRPDKVRLADGEIRDKPDGIQDTASQFVEMAHRFALNPALLQPRAVVPLTMARPGGIDNWVYDVAEGEILDLRLDHVHTPVQAFKLTPRPIPGRERYIYQQVWYSPALQFLPVRIRVDLGDYNGHVQLDVIGIDQR